MNTYATLISAIDEHALSVVNSLYGSRRNAGDVTDDILRTAGLEPPAGTSRTFQMLTAHTINALRPYGVRATGHGPGGWPTLSLTARPTR
mgnify:CR=1 FL=1|jgi:hypothetical protein